MKISLILSALTISVVAVGCSPDKEAPKAVPQVKADVGGGGYTTAVAPGGSGGQSASGASGLTIKLVGKEPDGSSPYAADTDLHITAVNCSEDGQFGSGADLKERFKHGANGLDLKVQFTYNGKKYEVVSKELVYGGGPNIKAMDIETKEVSSFQCDDTTHEI